jgi:hypothetical protein
MISWSKDRHAGTGQVSGQGAHVVAGLGVVVAHEDVAGHVWNVPSGGVAPVKRIVAPESQMRLFAGDLPVLHRARMADPTQAGQRENQPVTQTILSVAALVLSAITFVLAYRATLTADRRSRIPVLVFVYDNGSWILRNVGNGPALNIIVAIRWRHEDPADRWDLPTRVPPIATDREFLLTWLGASNVAVLAATYQDFLQANTSGEARSYSVTSRYDLNEVVTRRILPAWSVDETVPHWARDTHNR